MPTETNSIYEFGPFKLDTSEYSLVKDGKPVPLTPKAFEILHLLVRNNGRLVSRDELMKAVWRDSFVEEANLSVNISTLRKALGEHSGGQSYIETVPKRGYRFTAAVSERADNGASVQDVEIAETAELLPLLVAQQRTAPPQMRRAFSVFAGAVVVVLLTAFILGFLVVRKNGKPAVIEEAVPVRSLAVLPFKALSADSDPENQYLGLGITDALITRLGSLRHVVVRPTSAVLKYSGQHQDSIAAGRQLSVRAVLEGSIQRLEDRIRVTVRLLRVADGAPLWAGKFDERFTNMLEIEDSISSQVIDALPLHLSAPERTHLTRHFTQNSEAYQLYLKGRYFWNMRTADGLAKGIDYFEQAIRADPNYAVAYAGLADSLILAGSYGFSRMPPREAMPRATAAAEKALAIDDSLAEVHASLGFVKLAYHWDWSGAEKEFRRALELNPTYSTAHHWYSHFLTAVGRSRESLRETHRALELDPVALALNEHLGWYRMMSREFDVAIAQCRKTLDMDPNFMQARRVLGLSYHYRGLHADAIREFESGVALSHGDPVWKSLLARAYAAAGRRQEAAEIAAELERLSRSRYVSPADLSLVYSALGHKDQAFRWLEKAFEERCHALIYAKVDPAYDELREDPRFNRLVERLGLP